MSPVSSSYTKLRNSTECKRLSNQWTTHVVTPHHAKLILHLLPQDYDWSRYLTISTSAFCEPGSSVSTVSGYGMDDQAMEVRSPAQAKGFFL
jgi:hypothetical protein